MSEGGERERSDDLRSLDGGPLFRLSVVVCVYNEEQNLPRFLAAVLAQSGPSFRLGEIVAVASGCSDGSERILLGQMARHRSIRLIAEPVRRGKAAALSRGLVEATGDLVLVVNADMLPLPGSFEEIARQFRDPEMGLVCARLAPAGRSRGWTSRLSVLLWEVHDRVSEELPKSAGAIAFRRGPIDLPAEIEDDDTYLGILIGRGAGRSVFAKNAVFLHRIPGTIGELVRQRFRINRQIVGLRHRTGMTTSTWRPRRMARATGGYVRDRPRELPLVGLLALVEMLMRCGALVAWLVDPTPLVAWEPLRSTKYAIDPVAAAD